MSSPQIDAMYTSSVFFTTNLINIVIVSESLNKKNTKKLLRLMIEEVDSYETDNPKIKSALKGMSDISNQCLDTLKSNSQREFMLKIKTHVIPEVSLKVLVTDKVVLREVKEDFKCFNQNFIDICNTCLVEVGLEENIFPS